MKRCNFRHHLAAPVTALLLAGGLSGCHITPTPEPDPALSALSAAAHADVSVLSGTDPRGAEARERHAAELDGEIRRLCGHREDGSVPESCDLPQTTERDPSTGGDPSAVLPGSAEFIIGKLGEIPTESVPRVARMHAELAVLAGTTPDPSTAVREMDPGSGVGSVDVDAAREALDWEYSAIYGLGVAQAWADPEVAEVIGRSIEGHRDLAEALRGLLATVPDADPPVPAAGYTVASGAETPEDPASALAAAVRIDTDSALMWQAAAGAAEGALWRTWCVLAGSTSVLTAVPLLDAAGTDPAAAGLFDLP
ncbi:DUF4439 domain-containing protein [Corynebacterium sp. P7003]|uniref:DUF4439 domain-containing protein n=1 Tax=Corynebacterium pygosceleis TaxID=2800406 RepID=A0ABT3WNW4_9CORY|nr:DUF4439 domain-containing protein [Corynebacterium pygosceleis]MCX7443965.1 DUF4439 domain-containing protein [Corynebacterium pygosceleis]